MMAEHPRLPLVVLLLVGLAAIGGWVALELVAPHEVSLQCEPGDGGPQFVVSAHGINSIGSVIIWSHTKVEPLWAFRIGPTPVSPDNLTRFRYGELPHVPDPSLRQVKQAFPSAAAPRPIAPGEQFYVGVNYTHDEVFPPAASAGHRYFFFEMGPDGSATLREKTAQVEMPESVREVLKKMTGPDEL
jgi:hypothetical protein